MSPTPYSTPYMQSRQIIMSNHTIALGIQWILYDHGRRSRGTSDGGVKVFPFWTSRSDLEAAVVTLVTALCIASRKLLPIK
ncbi:hypothetical protein CKAH01_02119 [Colletotrichum kahawae]|uniref:Uncharacterized protein n=1 Tax=Colletotrichum kahawae TaxID=34407 RepID=A0AAD9Y0I0_COLKA|nr:hypothetical protein CKAH01_02119 [Colletotrichum kahawae]